LDRELESSQGRGFWFDAVVGFLPEARGRRAEQEQRAAHRHWAPGRTAAARAAPTGEIHRCVEEKHRPDAGACLELRWPGRDRRCGTVDLPGGEGWETRRSG